MIFGAIDLGTQTFRLGVAEVSEGLVSAKSSRLFNVRLGKVIEERKLNQKIQTALMDIKENVKHFGIQRLRVCGTEAIRALAQKAPNILEEIKEILSHPLEILSPQEEGRLTALGASTALGGTVAPQPICIIDVGGGSTETIYYSSQEILIKSIKIGAVKFTEESFKEFSFLSSHPFSQVKKATATGGTATTLGAMLLQLSQYEPQKIRGLFVNRETISSLIKKLSVLNLDERKKIIGLEPERADIIIPGLRILLHVVKNLDVPGVTISDGGLLMGILIDLIKKEYDDHAKLDWRRLYL
ncbi:Exopolyphosphatase [Dissulfuribacter thermophilus]|uniref:Exopolyphosphatase n=1 Tax=Dissulfuribacter thermophilus TaxID=1156395 RepID=A0A1B9F874_9BACT|nr:hypothetical protein [Dissulfuribacter thermophilus]OCC16139.1 Exopolyphosphatase [Dissulfuribacter thermophilus]